MAFAEYCEEAVDVLGSDPALGRVEIKKPNPTWIGYFHGVVRECKSQDVGFHRPAVDARGHISKSASGK